MSTVIKTTADQDKKVVVQNFVVARPPQRTQFDIATWRSAIDNAEAMYFPNRSLLYDIYEDAMLDPHLSRQCEKRVENITNTQWMFVDHDGKEVPEMMTFIDTPQFEQLLKELMGTKSHGISLIELGVEKKQIMGVDKRVLKMFSIPRKHVHPEAGTIVREQYDSSDSSAAIRYREGKYADYVAEFGDPKDLGILLNIAPYVILKKGGVSDWALFVQLFGQPFREYRYDGYDNNVRINLEQQAQEIGSAPYIILPEGATITLHEVKNSSSNEVHSLLAEYCDKMISIRILGNTLTTQTAASGSRSMGEVHQDTQDDVFAADKQSVRRMLNDKIVPILFNLGFPVTEGTFVPREEKHPSKILDALKVIKAVKDLGEPIDADLIYKEADIPKPENYDELKAEMEAAALDIGDDSGNVDRPDNRPGGTGNLRGKKPAKKKAVKLTFWDQMRSNLADFFDPAP